MTQVEFLWLSKNVPNILGIEQIENGVSVVKLRKNINIVHRPLRRNRITITFLDDGNIYIIPDKKTLNLIYEMHTKNEELTLLLKQYCDANLAHV